MEYPMCTLVRGNRNLRSLVGVTAHEMAHAWFQGLLATNESLHEWMDEGFTSWVESEFLAEEFNESRDQPHYWAYGGYLNLVRDGGEEPCPPTPTITSPTGPTARAPTARGKCC